MPGAAAPSAEPPASDDAKPVVKADDANPAAAPSTASAPAADAPMMAARTEVKPAEATPPNANAAMNDGKADASMPAMDEPKPANADATLAAADGEPMPQAMPSLPAPASSDAMVPGSPVVKAAAVVPPLPPGKHAWIQIASFRSEQNAQSAWKSMTDGNQDLLRYVPLSVRRVDLGTDKGVFYVLRIGPLASMEQAHDLCTALKDRKITCMVAK